MDTNSSLLLTVGNIMTAAAPYAGGSVPNDNEAEYLDWIRWIGLKQNEYAYRGQWRRLLKKSTLAITSGTAALPTNFYKPTGIYALFDADGNDLTNPDSETKLFVYMELDSTSANYGKWYVDTNPEVTISTTLYSFGAPPTPTAATDKVVLPGDLLLFGFLQEYFRAEGSEGSLDDARVEAENRFQEYLSLENLPTKQELASFSLSPKVINRTEDVKKFYTSRPGRYRT